ncbi:hypothetical protein PoB_006412600 [Plakobranchus ocellatus]|uniref:Uncharacterized protein n=1 Tax=Plakobranchus ocellatus TaxID=259542 RepID=A0AAV4D0W3_9GAST|nr:hypothetical protein PoB_006412600 [Plakobranchus ocellatus]
MSCGELTLMKSTADVRRVRGAGRQTASLQFHQQHTTGCQFTVWSNTLVMSGTLQTSLQCHEQRPADVTSSVMSGTLQTSLQCHEQRPADVTPVP